MNTFTPQQLRNIRNGLIDDFSTNKDTYVNNPSDYSQRRKLSFRDVINAILQMSGGSLNHELLSHFDFADNTPTAFAFVQQRSKILSTMFESLFHSFVQHTDQKSKYKGYQLLAIDGSDLHIPTNPNDRDSYFSRKNNQKSYNLLHLPNMMYLELVVVHKVLNLNYST